MTWIVISYSNIEEAPIHTSGSGVAMIETETIKWSKICHKNGRMDLSTIKSVKKFVQS